MLSKKILYPLFLVTTGLTLLSSPVQAETLIRTDAFFKNDKVGSDGINEVAHPFIILDLTNGRFKMRFDVRNVGSNTKLHSTPMRSTSLPANPCTDAQWVETDIESHDFRGNPDKNRVHALLEILTECQENGTGEYKEASKTFFYSAKVNVSNSSFARIYPGIPVGWTFEDNYTGTTLGTPDGTNEAYITREDPVTGKAKTHIISFESTPGVGSQIKVVSVPFFIEQ